MNWKTIKEFPEYEINTLGQVKRKLNNKILSQSLSSKGYYQINIANKSRRTHRLLAITFIDNPLNLETVNHINGNKLDNQLSNLEWMSRADNIRHSREELGIIPIPYSKSDKEHHLTGRVGSNSTRGQSIKVTLNTGEVKTFGSANQAGLEMYGDIKYGRTIRQAIKRGHKYKGLKFEKDE